MNKLLLTILLLSFGYNQLVMAETSNDETANDVIEIYKLYKDKDGELTWLANELAGCSGIFQAFSDFFKENKPATSENLKGYSTGAKVAAMYLFTKIKIARTGEVMNYGKAKPRVENVAYGPHNQVTSLFELKDIKGANVFLKKCVDLNEVQTTIIGQMREEIY